MADADRRFVHFGLRKYRTREDGCQSRPLRRNVSVANWRVTHEIPREFVSLYISPWARNSLPSVTSLPFLDV